MAGRYLGASAHPGPYASSTSSSTSPTDLQFPGWPPSSGFSFMGSFDAASSARPLETFSQATSSLPGSSGSLDVNELAGRLLSAIQERDRLQGALDESRRVCKEQAELISALKNITDLGPALQASPRRSDYVLVSNWNAADAKHNAKKPYLFIVDSQGNWVGKPRVSYAIQVGKTILQELHRLGLLSGSWRSCGVRPINLFINALEQAFVEFTYCAGHWKADHFAMLIFREWKRRRGKELKGAANGKRKRHDDDDEDDGDDAEDDDDEPDDKYQTEQSDNDSTQLANANENDGLHARKKQRRAVSESVASVELSITDVTRPPASAPSRPPPAPEPQLAQPPGSVPARPATPDGPRRPAIRFAPNGSVPTAQQLDTARSVLQKQRAAFTVPEGRSEPAAQGSRSIRGLRLPGENQPTADNAHLGRALPALEAQADSAGIEHEAATARQKTPSALAAPQAKPKGTHEFPLRKKSTSAEMHVRVAWAYRTPPEQVSRPNFEAYMKTVAGKAQLALMKVRVKTCQDTGLDA